MRSFPAEMIPERDLLAMYGWFGTPWPSRVCCGPSGQVIEELRKPVPVAEDCFECEERFFRDDSGHAVIDIENTGRVRIRHVHKECSARAVVGGLNHLNKVCSCHGGTDAPPEGMTIRQEAIAVWRRLKFPHTMEEAA